MRGVPKEDLLSQELRQQRRALRLAWLAASALLVFAVAAAWQWSAAVEQRRIAQEQRDRAERSLAIATDTANTLVFDLAQELRDRAGMPIALVRKILDRAEALQRQLADSRETTPICAAANPLRSMSSPKPSWPRAMLRVRLPPPSGRAPS